MLSALNVVTGELIILPVMDRPQVEEAREVAKVGSIRCRKCNDEVRVKAGDERIWHFAHKAKDRRCKLATEKANVLAVRAVLYRWLVERFKGKAKVEIEYVPEYSGLPKPVDCWVATPVPLAYCIFGAGLSSSKCKLYESSISPAIFVPVFTADMMNRKDGYDEPCARDRLTLTKTEYSFVKV